MSARQGTRSSRARPDDDAWDPADIVEACRAAYLDARFDVRTEADALTRLSQRQGVDLETAAHEARMSPRSVAWLRHVSRADPIATLGVERMYLARERVAAAMLWPPSGIITR